MSAQTTAAPGGPTAAAAARPSAGSVFRLTLILGGLTAFSPLAIDMSLPAFPHVAADLGASAGAVEFTLAAYLFGSAAGLVIARAVVRDLFEERAAARMFSQLMLVMGVAPVLAPWLGGQVLVFANWRVVFLLLVGFGVLCALVAGWFLPETLPPARRTKGGLPATLRAFGHLLRERHFLGYALVAGLGAGTLFAYIAGSPFVFIHLHHVSEQRFGLFFGANAAGFVGAAQLNRRLLSRYSPETILAAATAGGLVAGLLLAGCGLTGWGGLPALAGLLFACLFALGLVGPNVAAAALAPFGQAAGSASAFLGTAQFLVGALAGGLVGLLHTGTAVPMTAVVGATCAGSFVALRALAQPTLVQQARG